MKSMKKWVSGWRASSTQFKQDTSESVRLTVFLEVRRCGLEFMMVNPLIQRIGETIR